MFLASNVHVLLARHTVFSNVVGEGARDEGPQERIMSHSPLASHAGVFRGARISGGKKYELP